MNTYILLVVVVDFELGLFPRVKKATGSSQAVSEVLLLMKDFFSVIYIFKNNRITILIFYKPENHLYQVHLLASTSSIPEAPDFRSNSTWEQ